MAETGHSEGLVEGKRHHYPRRATSALDPLVEYDILSQFMEMIKDKTSVIISHRVGICRMADRIIVMKGGQVRECGKHEELF